MQRADKAKLDAEGAIYRKGLKYPFRTGWYLKDEFIGYNYKEALEWLYEHGY